MNGNALRYSPAGIPLLNFAIEHQSMQQEAGNTRQVDCRVEALACGPLAQRLATQPSGQMIRASGFLCKKSRNSHQLILHVQEFELL